MKWLDEKKKEVTWIDFINKDDNRTISIIPRYSDYIHLPKKDTYTIYYTYKGISGINKLPIDRFLYEVYDKNLIITNPLYLSIYFNKKESGIDKIIPLSEKERDTIIKDCYKKCWDKYGSKLDYDKEFEIIYNLCKENGVYDISKDDY